MTRQSDSQNQKKSAAHVSASTIHSTRPVALLIPVLIATVIGQLMLMFRCPPSELAQRMNLDSFGTMAMSSGFWILLATLLVMIWKMVLVARYRPTPAPTDAELPSLTVIVPAYNEGAQVLKTIGNMEVAVFLDKLCKIACVLKFVQTWNFGIYVTSECEDILYASFLELLELSKYTFLCAVNAGKVRC